MSKKIEIKTIENRSIVFENALCKFLRKYKLINKDEKMIQRVEFILDISEVPTCKVTLKRC